MSRRGKQWRASFIGGIVLALVANLPIPYTHVDLKNFPHSEILAGLFLIVVYTCLLWYVFFKKMDGTAKEFLTSRRFIKSFLAGTLILLFVVALGPLNAYTEQKSFSGYDFPRVLLLWVGLVAIPFWRAFNPDRTRPCTACKTEEKKSS